MKTCQLLRCAVVPKVAVWTYQIVLQNANWKQDKSYRNASTQLCHTSPSDRLDKSDRIGVETWYVFYCAAVSSSDTFRTVSILRSKKDLARKFKSNNPVRHNWSSCSENILSNIEGNINNMQWRENIFDITNVYRKCNAIAWSTHDWHVCRLHLTIMWWKLYIKNSFLKLLAKNCYSRLRAVIQAIWQIDEINFALRISMLLVKTISVWKTYLLNKKHCFWCWRCLFGFLWNQAILLVPMHYSILQSGSDGGF